MLVLKTEVSRLPTTAQGVARFTACRSGAGESALHCRRHRVLYQQTEREDHLPAARKLNRKFKAGSTSSSSMFDHSCSGAVIEYLPSYLTITTPSIVAVSLRSSPIGSNMRFARRHGFSSVIFYLLPQSSSASRHTAGAAGFFSLSQSASGPNGSASRAASKRCLRDRACRRGGTRSRRRLPCAH